VEAPSRPADEQARLAALQALDILDTEPEQAFERITSLAATLFRVPTVLVSLVDDTRQWFKSRRGLDASETSRDISFCGHAILQEEPFVVCDAQSDRRFVDNPLVTDKPNIRFYAGAPLTMPSGHRIGTLCLIDQQPRDLTALERHVLSDMAALVVSELELRSARREKMLEAAELQALLRDFPTPVAVVGTDDTLQFANAESELLMGYPPGGLVGLPYTQMVHPEERDASLHIAHAALLPNSRPRAVHRRIVKRNGEVLTVDGMLGRLHWGGKPALVMAMRDITRELHEENQREQVRERVMSEMRLLRATFDVLPNGVVLFDQQFRCVYANRAVGEMLGMEPSALRGWTPEDAARYVTTLVARGSRESVAPGLWRNPTELQDAAEPQVFSLVRPRPCVVRRTLHVLDSPTHPYLALWSDITHEAAALARSQAEATTDQLTGLPNRRAAATRLSQALSHGGATAVVLFDIDHFKQVNDTYGHGAGDNVLQHVAQALQSCARDGDFVARWGGEEFIGILRGTVEGGASSRSARASRCRSSTRRLGA
jgi:diguanylate cyclase